MIKKAFDQCAKECYLVAFFCHDRSFLEKIKAWAHEAKKKLFCFSCIYFVPESFKNEKDLVKKVLKAYDGMDMFYSSDEEDKLEKDKKEKEEKDLLKDLDIFQEDIQEIPREADNKNPVLNLIFNPPDKKFAAELCEKWNYTMGIIFLLIF